jgi:hypothetical protein
MDVGVHAYDRFGVREASERVVAGGWAAGNRETGEGEGVAAGDL